MDYYDKLINKISSIIDKSPKEALSLIEEELKVKYIPRDVLHKLNNFKSKINNTENNVFKLDIEDVLKYLKEGEDKQCLAIEELSKYNLRDYYETISDFLLSNGSLNAKIKLMLSLNKQDCSQTFSILKENKIYQFIPNKIILPENSEFYKSCIKVLDNYYMKNPDMLRLSKEILYNDCIYYLPLERNIKDVKYITTKLINYINKLFSNEQ